MDIKMKMAVVCSSSSSSVGQLPVLILALLLLHSDSGDFSAESCRTSYYTLYLSEKWTLYSGPLLNSSLCREQGGRRHIVVFAAAFTRHLIPHYLDHCGGGGWHKSALGGQRRLVWFGGNTGPCEKERLKDQYTAHQTTSMAVNLTVGLTPR